MTEDKSVMILDLHGIFGGSINWGNLSKQDITVLHNLFTKPEVVVALFSDKLNEEGKKKVIAHLQGGSSDSSGGSGRRGLITGEGGMIGGGKILDGFPRIKKIRDGINLLDQLLE